MMPEMCRFFARLLVDTSRHKERERRRGEGEMREKTADHKQQTTFKQTENNKRTTLILDQIK